MSQERQFVSMATVTQGRVVFQLSDGLWLDPSSCYLNVKASFDKILNPKLACVNMWEWLKLWVKQTDNVASATSV